MGHRHVYGTSQIFESENDQSWNPTEESYLHLAIACDAANGSIIYPAENMSIGGANFPPDWNPTPDLNGYSSSQQNAEGPYYQPESFGPSHDPAYVHPSAAGSFSMIPPENNGHHASSSNYGGQSFYGVEGSFFDSSMGNRGGPYKRKSPGVPSIHERGSTSRYAGSSSDLPMSSEQWHEKTHADFHHTAWDYPTQNPSYRGNSLSIGGDRTLRNVRSRAAIDLETNLARTHLSSNPLPHSYTASRPAEHSRSVDHLDPSSSAPARDWNQSIISPPVNDSSVFNDETNNFIIGSSNPSASLESGGYNNDFRNPDPQYLQGEPNQSVRGARNNYIQRYSPMFRPSSSNLHAARSDEESQFVAESYSSRHSRPFSNLGWRNSDRNGRTRIYNERYRPLSDEVGVRDRLASQRMMLVERSAMHGSRSLFDEHRDMRLDIDDMSYEDLLALGERIGSVSTGLSEDLITKCLTESIYCSSDQIQDEGSCVICLEEYKNMDDVGMLKACRHDFHVGCIRKWLSLKNVCPICKSSAVADHL